jgi:hypothetical protein
MIDRTHWDADFEVVDAQLTGLVPQLTTPSRYIGELVDIWFGICWRERSVEWDESFARLSKGWRPDPQNPSFFDLFSHPSSNGLIAARQVSADRTVWQRVEEEARMLIGRVNRDVAERRNPPAPAPRSARGWSLRVRDASSGIFAALRWISEPKHALPVVVPKLPIQVSHSSPTRSR